MASDVVLETKPTANGHAEPITPSPRDDQRLNSASIAKGGNRSPLPSVLRGKDTPAIDSGRKTSTAPGSLNNAKHHAPMKQAMRSSRVARHASQKVLPETTLVVNEGSTGSNSAKKAGSGSNRREDDQSSGSAIKPSSESEERISVKQAGQVSLATKNNASPQVLSVASAGSSSSKRSWFRLRSVGRQAGDHQRMVTKHAKHSEASFLVLEPTPRSVRNKKQSLRAVRKYDATTRPAQSATSQDSQINHALVEESSRKNESKEQSGQSKTLQSSTSQDSQINQCLVEESSRKHESKEQAGQSKTSQSSTSQDSQINHGLVEKSSRKIEIKEQSGQSKTSQSSTSQDSQINQCLVEESSRKNESKEQSGQSKTLQSSKSQDSQINHGLVEESSRENESKEQSSQSKTSQSSPPDDSKMIYCVLEESSQEDKIKKQSSQSTDHLTEGTSSTISSKRIDDNCALLIGAEANGPPSAMQQREPSFNASRSFNKYKILAEIPPALCAVEDDDHGEAESDDSSQSEKDKHPSVTKQGKPTLVARRNGNRRNNLANRFPVEEEEYGEILSSGSSRFENNDSLASSTGEYLELPRFRPKEELFADDMVLTMVDYFGCSAFTELENVSSFVTTIGEDDDVSETPTELPMSWIFPWHHG